MTETTLTQEHIDFLDELRESGDTNMFGAQPYIVDEFGIDKHGLNFLINIKFLLNIINTIF